jgi:hypothetical protein
MQNDQPQINYQPPLPKKTSHRILLIIGSILLTLIIVISVAYLLKNLGITKNTPATQSTALTADQLIDAFGKEGAIKAFSSNAYSLQSTDTNEGKVIFKSENADYTVDTPTKEVALYAAKDANMADDTNAVQDQVRSFMKERGYEEANNTASALYKNPAFLTFVSGGAVCQLSSAHPEVANPLPGYHKMSCVSKEDVTKEYAAIKNLMDIYKKDYSYKENTEVVRSTKTDANKSLATIDILNDGKQTSLLFAAIDSSWEFIANLSEGSENSSNGKYTISPQAQQAMANPKYGDFLTKNIQR